MKKRTAFIGAILSLIPFGQPLIIKTGLVLSTASYMVSFPENLYARDAAFYLNRANKKYNDGDFYGAISDYNKSIEINPKDELAFANRGVAKKRIGDMKGACIDWQKASSLGDEIAAKWFRNQC